MKKPYPLYDFEVRYWAEVVRDNKPEIAILEEMCNAADWNFAELVNWLRAQGGQ